VEQSAAQAVLISKRREAAERATSTKSQRLEAYVSDLTIAIRVMPLPAVIERACEDYNRRMEDIEEERMDDGHYDFMWTPATSASDPLFLQRIMVNYLRHSLSRYDDELARLLGRVGVRAAYAQLNQKMYSAITQSYPELTAECIRQVECKFGAQADHGSEEDHQSP
jgi:hypothetical protein